jgi:hypothetical protein
VFVRAAVARFSVRFYSDGITNEGNLHYDHGSVSLLIDAMKLPIFGPVLDLLKMTWKIAQFAIKIERHQHLRLRISFRRHYPVCRESSRLRAAFINHGRTSCQAV